MLVLAYQYSQCACMCLCVLMISLLACSDLSYFIHFLQKLETGRHTASYVQSCYCCKSSRIFYHETAGSFAIFSDLWLKNDIDFWVKLIFCSFRYSFVIFLILWNRTLSVDKLCMAIRCGRNINHLRVVFGFLCVCSIFFLLF